MTARRLLYAALTALIALAFLAQMMRGECPVP
jgi:hypothetical protein